MMTSNMLRLKSPQKNEDANRKERRIVRLVFQINSFALLAHSACWVLSAASSVEAIVMHLHF